MIIGEHAVIRAADCDDAPGLWPLYEAPTPRSFTLGPARQVMIPTRDEFREILSRKDLMSGVFFVVEDKCGLTRGACALRGGSREAGHSEAAVALLDEADYGAPLADEVMAFLRHKAFDERNLIKISAYCVECETAYRAFLLRSGFSSDGVQRDLVYTLGRYFGARVALHVPRAGGNRIRWANTSACAAPNGTIWTRSSNGWTTPGSSHFFTAIRSEHRSSSAISSWLWLPRQRARWPRRAPSNIIDSHEHGPIGLASFRFNQLAEPVVPLRRIRDRDVSGSRRGAAALDCAVGYGFDEMNLHRLSRDVFADDEKTRRLMERVGAKQDALLPGHILREGTPVDVCRFGLLRPDFRSLTGAPTAAVGRGD